MDGGGGEGLVSFATTVQIFKHFKRARRVRVQNKVGFAVWHACLFKHMPLSSAVRVCYVFYVCVFVCVCWA